MSYTEPIDPDTPAGTDPVSQGDNQLRALKLAVVERLGSMVRDVEVDPLEVLGRAAEGVAELGALRVNGTIAEPTAVLADELVAGLAAYARGATLELLLGRIIAVARENVTDTEAGALWRVSLNKVGEDSPTDLFDIRAHADGHVEIISEEGMRFSSKNAGTFEFDGELHEEGGRAVATGFDTTDGQPNIFDAGNLDAGGLEIDWANGPVQLVTLTGTGTLTFVGAVAGGTYMLLIAQSSGGHTPTLTGWDFGSAAPVPWAGGAGERTLVSALYTGSDYVAGVGHVAA